MKELDVEVELSKIYATMNAIPGNDVRCPKRGLVVAGALMYHSSNCSRNDD